MIKLVLITISITVAFGCKPLQHGCYVHSGSDRHLLHSDNSEDTHEDFFSGTVIGWDNFGPYLQKAACRCNQAAAKGGYPFFSLRDFGECHGIGKGSTKFSDLNLKKSVYCFGTDLNQCTSDHEHCTGAEMAEFIYETKPEQVLLSQGKPSKQSSTYLNNEKTYGSHLAFDGTLSQKLKRTCSHTYKSPAPWIQVDLLKPATIYSVKIANILESYRNRLNNVKIYVSNNENFNGIKQFCAGFVHMKTIVQTFTCKSPLIGRYVRLVNNNNYLHICEMQVFGMDNVAAPVCPIEKGFCVKQNGGDQNSGVIKINNVDGNTQIAQEKCLEHCQKNPKATGCEVIWDQHNRGCYIHTQEIARGNEVGRHMCWVFSKCTLNHVPPAVCPIEKGFCVKKDGKDQNSGVIKMNSIDGNSENAQKECLELCQKNTAATGCEVIWDQFNRGCYIHTQEIARGNAVDRHLCWVFSKCRL